MYSTYKYYDNKGRRLAVFCQFINETQAEILIITCSKSDQFSKKIARSYYNDYIENSINTSGLLYKPQITIVDITPEERELQTLIRYCNENLYTFIEIPIDSKELIKVSQLEKLLKNGRIKT